MEQAKKDFYESVTAAYEFAKSFQFIANISNSDKIEMMHLMDVKANEIVKKETGKKQKLLKKLLIASIEFYEDLWREENGKEENSQEAISS